MSAIPTPVSTMGFALDLSMVLGLDSSVSVKKVTQEHIARHLSLVRYCVIIFSKSTKSETFTTSKTFITSSKTFVTGKTLCNYI